AVLTMCETRWHIRSFQRNAEYIWHKKRSCMAKRVTKPTSFRRTELRNSRRTANASKRICSEELLEKSLSGGGSKTFASGAIERDSTTMTKTEENEECRGESRRLLQ